MYSSRLSGKLWPVHFKPQDDELLSSWLARLAAAHGLPLSSLLNTTAAGRTYPYRLLAVDIDKSPPVDLLNSLVEKTGTPSSKILSATLLSHEGQCYEKNGAAGKTQWVLPINRKRLLRSHSLQYCPRCLAEDKEPFFRRSWRLAFIILCPRHGAQLLDNCPACGKGVDFYGGFKSIRGLAPYGSITTCFSCRADIRDISHSPTTYEASTEEIRYQEFLAQGIEQGMMKVSDGVTVYSLFYYQVLRKVIKILTMNRGEDLRKRVCTALGLDLHPAPFRFGGRRWVEEFNVSERRALLNMARWLLKGWPERFIECCKASGIGWQASFATSKYIPFWYWSVAREHLDRPNYRPTKEEIRSAITYYRKMTSRKNHQSHPDDLKAVSTFLRGLHSTRKKGVYPILNIPSLIHKTNRGQSNSRQD